jgi:prevent-host-death family protein
MTTLVSYEGRTHSSRLHDQVARGKNVLITRRGKPAAVLYSPPAEETKDVGQVIAAMKVHNPDISARRRSN